MSSKGKLRLSDLLVARGLSASKEDAERLIRAGDVIGPSERITQPNALVDSQIELRLAARTKYVSRGGDKLEGALTAFGIDPMGLRCLDVGASTGGFTDCLLQQGASAVVALDVGTGQLDWKLRSDPRVTTLDGKNIRKTGLQELGAPFGLIVVDVSFTDVRTLMPRFAQLLKEEGILVLLVKPQFELLAHQVGVGGIVSDPASQIECLQWVIQAANEAGLASQQLTFSPIKGRKGNIEFLLSVKAGGIPATIDCESVVVMAHKELDRDVSAPPKAGGTLLQAT